MKRSLPLILSMLLAPLWCAGQPTTAPTTRPSFRVFVWMQSYDDATIAKWRSRAGPAICFVESPGSPSSPQYPAYTNAWAKALDAAGVDFIINPNNTGADASVFAKMPHCLSLNQSDEPNRQRSGQTIHPADCVAAATAWHGLPAQAMLNYDYSRMWPWPGLGVNPPAPLQAPTPEFNSPATLATGASNTDWLGADLYYYAAWGSQSFLGGESCTVAGRIITDLIALNPKARTFEWIETGTFGNPQLVNLPPAAQTPTGAQFFAMNWASVIAGAKGVGWFPVNPNNGNSDITTPDIDTAMKTFSGQIATYGDTIALGVRTPLVLSSPLVGAQWVYNGHGVKAILNTLTYDLSLTDGGGITPDPTPTPTTQPTIIVNVSINGSIVIDGKRFVLTPTTQP